jgi:hypothetical protein
MENVIFSFHGQNFNSWLLWGLLACDKYRGWKTRTTIYSLFLIYTSTFSTKRANNNTKQISILEREIKQNVCLFVLSLVLPIKQGRKTLLAQKCCGIAREN